ncbi:MAG TPA: hypothetical protein VIF37_15820 [Methylobacter sp.]|jgi:hypothetical protein
MTQLNSKARTAIIFNPPADIPSPTSRQIADAFRFHTTGVNSLTVVAQVEAVPWIENYLPDIAIEDPGVLRSNNFESIVFVHPFKDPKFYIPPFEPSGWRPSAPRIRFYAIDANGRLLPAGREYDDQDAENMDAHIFNRLSKPEGEALYYFPYGYLFRYPGVGPTNQFGFRVPDDLSGFKNRDPEHKLVLCYGGSSGFSMFTLPHQMYTSVMEASLNKKALESGSSLRFTVLNFGQHGNVVMNSILTYVLFNFHLKPDFIVAHDGWNDIIYGMVQDPRLLKCGNFAYQNNLEGWSQILHGTQELQQTQTGTPFRPLSAAPAVLGQYFTRKRQFESMVRANGAQFIWGLQPNSFNKRHLHPLEATNIEAHEKNMPFIDVYRQAIPLFQRASEQLDKMDVPKLDLYEEFGKYGKDDYLFVDPVHLSPDGDEIVGRNYADVIANLCGLN